MRTSFQHASSACAAAAIWAAILIASVAVTHTAFAQTSGPTPTLAEVIPVEQRVHEYIELRGSGFGLYQPGTSRVVFSNGSVTIEGGTPYLWRDDLIRLRVPVGDLIGPVKTEIPKGNILVQVEAGGLSSVALPFKVIHRTSTQGMTLAFTQLTKIQNDVDISTVLGSPNLNLARTKDAEIGDVNGDGLPDLIDDNSSNVPFADPATHTHGVRRLNLGNGNFETRKLEPVVPGCGNFATFIPSGGTLFGDDVSYDSDLIDFDGDGLPDLMQVMAIEDPGVRVLINNHQQIPGCFREATSEWLGPILLDDSPDDLDHADIDGDGWVDVAVAQRSSNMGEASVLLNSGTNFGSRISVTSTGFQVHDVFLLDADDDGDHDLVTVPFNSASTPEMFQNIGSSPLTFGPPQALFPTAAVRDAAGDPADLNGDGLPDAVIAGRSDAGLAQVAVFLNSSTNPGSFNLVASPALVASNGLEPITGAVYDVEFGDLDLDGDVDVVLAINDSLAQIQEIDPDFTIKVWLNNGNGGFTDVSGFGASSLLPDRAPYQRMSVDLLDLDLDGDLDLYVTGADGQDIGFGFGRAPNQLYENQRLECRPPTIGDWHVDVSCRLIGQFTAPGNVIVEDRSTLTIADGSSLTIDLAQHFILVKDGSRVQVSRTPVAIPQCPAQPGCS